MDDFKVIKLNKEVIDINDVSKEKLNEYLEELSNNKDECKKSIDEILSNLENQ